MSYGQEARVGISFQNSYGTVLTSSMHWMEPISETVSLKKAQNVAKGLTGRFDQGTFVEGMNTVDGDITIEGKANGLGVLLTATNNLVSTVTSSALRVHTFRPRTADHQVLCPERPFTMHKHLGDAGSAHNLFNLNGNTLELAVSNGQLMTAKMGVVGGDFSRVAAIAATYSDSNPIDWAVSSISIGGTAVNYITQLTVTQNNNLQPKFSLDGSRTPSRIVRSDTRTIEIAGTLMFDDQVQATAFINQTEQRLIATFKGTANVQSGYPEQLIIDIPSMRFTDFPMVIAGPNQIEVSFKAAAAYNVGSLNSITYTLHCGKAY